MAEGAAFRITYWGTTGSMPAPLLPQQVTRKLAAALSALQRAGALGELAATDQPDRLVSWLGRHLPFYLSSTWGGNTTCIEVQTPESLIIVDAGSGFRALAGHLAQRWNRRDYGGSRTAHILITHGHMDHVHAMPFAETHYDERNRFTVWAPQSALDGMQAVWGAGSPLQGTFYPLSFEAMPAVSGFRAVEPGGEFMIGQTQVATLPLQHPGGCVAYRLKYRGRTVVFASDHEHREVPDRGLAEFARQADLFYCDGQYRQEEYEGRVGVAGEPPTCRQGWGHSTVEAAIATAICAGVRRLHLGHRDPKRGDAETDELQSYAQSLMRRRLIDGELSPDACQVAIPYEGMVVEL